MNFAKYGDRDRKQQAFDKEKITITKAGVTVNVYDQIQAANVDTNIYEVMKKYHLNEDEAVQFLQEKGGEQGIFQDIRALQENIKDIGDVMQTAQKAQEMFENLPNEVKQKYGNNLVNFFHEQKKKQVEEKTDKTDQVEGVNNETK